MKNLFSSFISMFIIFHGTAQAVTFVSAEQKLLSVVTNELMVPAYRDMAESAQVFSDKTVRACHPYKNVGEPLIVELRQQWQNTALQWSATQAFSGGPVSEPYRYWRIQFWPDKKDLVLQKFRPLLQSAPGTVSTPEELAQKSIALQGLGALEFLLFDQRFSRTEARDERWCNLLMATAFNLKQESEQTHQKWLAEKALWLYYDEEDDPQIQFNNKISTFFLGALVALDVAKGRKLGEPLRLEQGKLTENSPNIYLFEYWRSGTSLKSIRAMLLSLQQNYLIEGGLRTYLLAKEGQFSGTVLASAQLNDKAVNRPDAEALDASIKAQFESAIALSDALIKSVDTSEAGFAQAVNGSGREQFYALYIKIRELLLSFKSDYTTIKGIKVGFNSNDGD